MSKQDIIICPSCGAENSQYGKCEFCGTLIKEPVYEPKTNTKGKSKTSAESFAEKISKYHEVEPFRGGVAIVRIGKQYGAINENGDLIIPMSYSVVNKNGLLEVYEDEDGYGKLYDSKGNLISDNFSIFSNYSDTDKGGGYFFTDNGILKIINSDNQIITISLPQGINISHQFYDERRNLITVHDDPLYDGLYDFEQKQFVLPCNYLIYAEGFSQIKIYDSYLCEDLCFDFDISEPETITQQIEQRRIEKEQRRIEEEQRRIEEQKRIKKEKQKKQRNLIIKWVLILILIVLGIIWIKWVIIIAIIVAIISAIFDN